MVVVVAGDKGSAEGGRIGEVISKNEPIRLLSM